MYGHAGKILRVDLTDSKISTINTEDYSEWIGGHGMGAAIWFDIVKDKTISSGFDPGNILAIMPGLFSGTLVPASCRTQMVGIQVLTWPYEWFGRSNAGGRFANMLKWAGYDGIIIEGAAGKPTWLNIVDDDVRLNDATHLWGMDAHATQKAIFKDVIGSNGPGDWVKTGGNRLTTQRPAVLAIGPAGENKSRLAVVLTEHGNAFGNGGYGGIWGAKNLKAISALGTGGIEVADPKALMETRLWAQKNYATDYDNPKVWTPLGITISHFGGYANANWSIDPRSKPSGCNGCHINCQPRTSSGMANEAICGDAMVYRNWDKKAHGTTTEISAKAVDLAQRLGINSKGFQNWLIYLTILYDKGVLGPGKKIDTDLPMDKIGEAEFIEDFLHKIAYREGIGDDLAEGFPRAAQRWGRVEEDLRTGILPMHPWGYSIHYDGRCEAYWWYASMVESRDVNMHDFNIAAYRIGQEIASGKTPLVPATQVADWFGELAPYYDPEMMNFADDNLYSIHMARTTAWLLHYSYFWKHSCGLCSTAFSDLVNPNGINNRGLTPDGEVRFYQAVTGKKLTFEESMEIGRKIYNLDKAIWTLQGRHRDMEKFPEYMYSVPSVGSASATVGAPQPYYMPTKENGEWDYRDVAGRYLDREKVEEWKTTFYKLQGWDPKTGWQTRATLESLGLQNVADELAGQGKLDNSI